MSGTAAIICPDAELASVIAEALLEAGAESEPVVWSRYPHAGELAGLIENRGQKVEIVIVALTERQSAIQTMEEVSEAFPGVVLMGAGRDPGGDDILAALRCGAVQFLTLPIDAALLGKYLRPAQKARPATRKGQIHCVLPAQGGSGASTIAQHVAWSISKWKPEEVLLADWDADCGLTAFDLGLQPEYTLADAAHRVDSLDELWGRVSCRIEGLAVLPAAPPSYLNEPDARERLSGVLASAAECYEFVFVDLPVGFSALARDVVERADFVYLICTTDVRALRLARRRARELMDLGLPKDRLRLIANRVGSSRSLRENDVAEAVGLPLYWALPNEYEELAEARIEAGFLAPEGKLGRQLRQLAAEIAGRRQEEGRKQRRWWQLLPA